MSVDILGTNCDQCRSMVQCCFTSTETVRTERPGRTPRLTQSDGFKIPPFDSHYPFSGLGLVETGNRVAGRTQQRQIGLRTAPCCTHRILAPRHDRCMLSSRRTAKRIKEAADNHEVGWDLLSWCFTSTVTRFIRVGEQSGTERSRDRELWESRSGRPGLPVPIISLMISADVNVSRFGLAVRRRLVRGRILVRCRFGSPFSTKRLWFVDTVLWLCPSLPAETLKWLSSLPILMQKSFWWWQCSDRYIISPPPTSIPPPPLLPVPNKP